MIDYVCSSSPAQALLLDPLMLMYLFMLGDNALEEQFAVLRTATHQRNFDLLQFRDSIAVAGQMTVVYDKHADWQRNKSKLSVRDDRDRPHVVTGEV